MLSRAGFVQLDIDPFIGYLQAVSVAVQVPNSLVLGSRGKRAKIYIIVHVYMSEHIFRNIRIRFRVTQYSEFSTCLRVEPRVIFSMRLRLFATTTLLNVLFVQFDFARRFTIARGIIYSYHHIDFFLNDINLRRLSLQALAQQ